MVNAIGGTRWHHLCRRPVRRPSCALAVYFVRRFGEPRVFGGKTGNHWRGRCRLALPDGHQTLEDQSNVNVSRCRNMAGLRRIVQHRPGRKATSTYRRYDTKET